MFIGGAYTQCYAVLFDWLLYMFELPISQYSLYFESMAVVCLYYLINWCHQCFIFHVLTNSAVPRCMLQDLVITKGIFNKHHINCKCDFPVSFHDFLWYIVYFHLRMLLCSSRCFHFYQSDVWSKMSSVQRMSCLVTGQFGIRFYIHNQLGLE